MNRTLIIIPIAIYLIAMLYIAYRVNNIKNSSKSFTNEYYLGSRSMGGFVLAMTIDVYKRQDILSALFSKGIGPSIFPKPLILLYTKSCPFIIVPLLLSLIHIY